MLIGKKKLEHSAQAKQLEWVTQKLTPRISNEFSMQEEKDAYSKW